MSVFARFAPRLQQAIVSRLGWTSLRPVQEEAGEALLAGANAVVLAPTAGGKTEAAMFPVLSRLVEDPPDGVAAIYVAPIKALLNNQADRLGLYTEMVSLRRFVWHGDTSDHLRRQFLKEPADLLMTTPESLEVMLVSQRVDAGMLFRDLRVVVIDEIHAMAGTDRGAHLMSVLERIARLSRHDVQRIGLSATVGNPQAILGWLGGTSRRDGRVVDPPRDKARRQLRVAYHPELGDLAADAARAARAVKSLFFCQSRAMTEAVAEHMRRAGTTVFVHHSAVSREEREIAEERFHHGTDACIVCTSTLELGIDVGDLDRVLQADAPATVSSFLQRMGRTGRRAGQVANTSFYCQSTDAVLQAIALVELAKGGWVEEVALDDRCWPVLIHQLLVMALAESGVPVEEAWAHLSKIPDFRGIHRAEYDRLLRWMLKDGALLLVGGRLVLGPLAERLFGRRNFMELYAVFSSPQSYTVETAGAEPLGSLSQSFVDTLVDGVSCFLLGGRAWAVLGVRHDDRRVVVEPAPSGKQPTWGGFLPQFLGQAVAGRILGVLASKEPYPYLTGEAASRLDDRRARFAGLLDPERGGVEVDDDGNEIRWWTFAGGRVNATLRYALLAVGADWKVIPDNFMLRVQGRGLTPHAFREAQHRLEDVELWEDAELWRRVAQSLPAYRLSKFQPLMPPWVEREVIASYLLDVAGAWRWLSGTSTVPAGVARVAEGIRVPSAREEARHDPGAPPRLAPAQDQAIAPALEPSQGPPRAPTPSPADGASLDRPTPLLAAPAGGLVPPLPQPDGRRVWIAEPSAFAAMCQALAGARVISLDVETTLRQRSLCLVQVATADRTYLVDPMEIGDLDALAAVLADPTVIKVIHNASFERSVLGRHGLRIEGVVDTLTVSRDLRGRSAPGGHSLQSVCARELGVYLDKSQQTSDWSRRPLTSEQLAYAALDAEVLLRLYARFENERPHATASLFDQRAAEARPVP